MDSISRPLRVFLCHSSGDKPTVRELYRRLEAEEWIDVWLDEEKLFPGQDWDYEIEKALNNSDAVIVTLSTGSVSKEGYVQKELRFVLDIALEKPEGTIFILPVRLDDCERPRRLRSIQGIDYFPIERRERAYARLRHSLELRAKHLNLSTNAPETTPVLGRSSPSFPKHQIPQTSTRSPAINPKSTGSVSFRSAETKLNTIWQYGRVVAILLLIIGFFGPWYTGLGLNGAKAYASLIAARDIFVIIPLAVAALFLVTLARLLPWRFRDNKAIARFERIAAGIASITLPLAPLEFSFMVLNLFLLWGWGVSVVGVYVAIINILLEMRSTLQKGQKWPWWARLLAASFVLPWLLSIGLFLNWVLNMSPS